MNRTRLPRWCLAGLLLAATLASARDAVRSAPATLRLPPHQRRVLANGLTLILSEQHEVPLVSFEVQVRVGSAADPSGRDGAASLTAELLRRGTRTRSAEELAGELDFMGATLETQVDVDHTRLQAEFLRKDLTNGVELLLELLQMPTFPDDEFQKLRQRRIDAVKEAKDEMREVVPRYFLASLFREHPYGRPPDGDERSLAAIQRADVLQFHERFYGPSNVIIAVVGDFHLEAMAALLESKWGRWQHPVTPPPRLEPIAEPLPSSRVVLVNKPEATQTFFMLGHGGVPRGHPDRVALRVVNTLFGGRFTSLLNDALRINSGLTYGASSQFQSFRAGGAFSIFSFTRNATTTNALDLALAVLKKLRADGVTDEQLRSAKAYIKGQFPLSLETTDQLAATLADLECFGLDAAEVDELFARLDRVTVADARRVIRECFLESPLLFVLIGQAAELSPVAARYAEKVERMEINDPTFHP